MADIAALMRALPVSALEPDWIASISGFVDVPEDRKWREHISLLEPPAGQHTPYIEPVNALEKLLRHQGVASETAQTRAREIVARMKDDVPERHWVVFFNFIGPESPECLPVSAFVGWLRGERERINRMTTGQNPDALALKDLASDEIAVSPEITDFFEQAVEVTTCSAMFCGPDNRDAPWTLKTLPAMPPPKAVIEFVPGAPWHQFEWDAEDNPFLTWREAIRPVAAALEEALGEPVYYFSDLDNEQDDDSVHRLLVLHWCCTREPDSAFVKYLLKASGACDVKELKAALIDPASYTQPFEMNDTFLGLEASACRINYLPPGTRKTVAVVFSTLEARQVAQRLLMQKIGADVRIIAPQALATNEWIQQATRFCRSWEAHYMFEHELNAPIGSLALVDELCVVADEKTPGSGFDLKLPETVEDLLWLALDLGIKATYYDVEGRLMNADTSLKKRGVPERAAARKTQRTAFTRQLTELRLENEYGSSGLWDSDGKMLSYDLLDLPFSLVRRIAAWHRDFEESVIPPDKGSQAWWKRHRQEEIEIARALKDSLRSDVAVRISRHGRWMTVDEVEHTEAGNA